MKSLRIAKTQFVFAALLAMFLCLAPAAYGDIILSIDPSNQVSKPGSSGSFDVRITNVGMPDTTIGGFSFNLAVPAGSPVDFTGATDATPDYIFAGGSFGFVSFPGFPNEDFVAGDVSFPPGVTLSDGDTFTLGRVFFDVDNSVSPGPFNPFVVPVTFESLGFLTALSDENAQSIPFQVQNGQITLIPEPATLTIFGFVAVAGVCGYGARRLRRRKDAIAA